MTDEQISSLITSSKVYSFPEVKHFTHNGCMVSSNTVGIETRKAFLECPYCFGLDDFYNTKEAIHYQPKFCPGNQPIEHEYEGKMHPVACGGVIEPHFHVFCSICSCVFLLSIPRIR